MNATTANTNGLHVVETTARTAPHVYQAITAVTAAMAREGLGKTRKNDQQGYKFRGIDDIYNVLSSHLAACRLCILPCVVDRTVTERPTLKGGVSTYVVLTFDFVLVSSEDGSKHTIRTMGEAMDTADKATNKAMSAAMKYACLLAFQIPTEGDNDADAHHHEKTPATGPTLAKGLSASVDANWPKWEERHAAALRTANSRGGLLEAWTEMLDSAKRVGAPVDIIGRLSALKDERKAAL